MNQDNQEDFRPSLHVDSDTESVKLRAILRIYYKIIRRRDGKDY